MGKIDQISTNTFRYTMWSAPNVYMFVYTLIGALKDRPCLSHKIYSTLPRRKRRDDANWRALYKAQTLISWMLNVQAATRSQLCSAMPRQLCCAYGAPRCCASPQEARQDSQRDAPSGGSNTKREVKKSTPKDSSFIYSDWSPLIIV